jgi:hypothetical protein
MRLLGVIQRQKKSLWPLLLVLPTVLSGAWLAERYYQHFERPMLLAPAPGRTYTACDQFVSALPDRAPRACDLASSTLDAGGAITETFVFDNASKLNIVSRDGRWQSSFTECTTAARLSIVSIIGLAIFGVGVFVYSFRTGQWFNFPGIKRAPMNDFEIVVVAYGVTIFAGNFVSLANAACV